MIGRVLTVSGLLAAAVVGTPAVAADKITIAAVTARLLYEGTGKLSKDLTPPGSFSGHNTIIGEGAAEEPANDILVTVVLAAPGGANGENPLVVVVRRVKDGKVLAGRIFATPFVGTTGKAYRSLIAADATCDTIEIAASYGKIRKTAKIEFHCGE